MNLEHQILILKGPLATQTKLQLYDILGRQVIDTELNIKNTEHTLGISDLVAGLYALQLQDTAGLGAQR
jgi:hypothetical protein